MEQVWVETLSTFSVLTFITEKDFSSSSFIQIPGFMVYISKTRSFYLVLGRIYKMHNGKLVIPGKKSCLIFAHCTRRLKNFFPKEIR